MEAEPSGLVAGWITPNPANGSIAPGQVVQVGLAYDISQQGFQGTYAANVLITTSGRPVAKVGCTVLAPQDVQRSIAAQ